MLHSALVNFFIITVWFSNADSKGSPWDWQSGNARFPDSSVYEREKEQQRGSNPMTLRVNSNVTAYVGQVAHLPCRVKNLGEYTVSWLRGRDMSVLSVGHVTFSSDSRYHVVHVARPMLEAADWNLEIRSVTPRDAGWYDCQVNTEPKISNKSYLAVKPRPKGSEWEEHAGQVGVAVKAGGGARKMHDSPVQPLLETQDYLWTTQDPVASISGPSIVHAAQGATLTLDCAVSRLPQAPSSFYWTHNLRVLTPKRRARLSLESEKLAGTSRGKLVIVDLGPEDAGTYACVTDLTAPAEIEVYIDPPEGASGGGGGDDGDDGAEALASRVSSSSIPPVSMAPLIFVLLALNSCCSGSHFNLLASARTRRNS